MNAWLNDPELKARIVAQVQAHYDADEIVQGKYWEGGKGCAVGCILHDRDGGHSRFPGEFGIPGELARLVDSVFEGLSKAHAKELPLRFVTAIPVGADLSMVIPRFLVWLLMDPTHGVIRLAGYGAPAVQRVADLYGRAINGGNVTREEWDAAGDAAGAAMDARDAGAAAWAAARAASDAARDAWAARAAGAAGAARAARAAQADKLIALLQETTT